ncbi:PRC-barrel domain-containing protein [Paraburkholderia sacchari]|uniref:PRC-barrel domain containing protein n=1 Tax=Paraburkholderia sacchari TaxID=159450 RepID=A0A8T6Z6E1_9BURK|nr:PRC-barrel domain-containing protein [Paraburkholderia sacchari]NLP60272.1 PRC-barrel domain containing protein [Paraburkholderia sacchari]
MALKPESQQTGARIVGQGNETAAGPGPYVMAASTLEGDRVFSSDNQEIGKIKEIMLEVDSGRVAYAVMSSGGFLGIGDKLLALPWSALTLDTTNKCFLLNVSAERVKHAPGFDKDHWPAMADLEWRTTVHEYYGTPGYWENGLLAERGEDLPPEEPGSLGSPQARGTVGRGGREL